MTSASLALERRTTCDCCGFTGPLCGTDHAARHLVVRLARKTARPPPPRRRTLRATHVLLDASALIAAGNGEAPGLLGLLRDPPPGYSFWATTAVLREVRWTRFARAKEIRSLVQVADPAHAPDRRITETRGAFDIPSAADAGLVELALEDARFGILVSGDGVHARSGIAVTLRINDRLRVMTPEAFVRSARRRRALRREVIA